MCIHVLVYIFTDTLTTFIALQYKMISKQRKRRYYRKKIYQMKQTEESQDSNMINDDQNTNKVDTQDCNMSSDDQDNDKVNDAQDNNEKRR